MKEKTKQENKAQTEEQNKEQAIRSQVEKESRVDIYKWIKILQAIILMVLGILFIIMSVSSNNGDDISLMLSLSMGIVLSVYSVMEILSGYLLYRHPFNRDVLFGEVLLALGIVMFIKRDVLSEILSYFVIAYFFIFAVMLIVYGIDAVVHKPNKHSLRDGILSFIAAGLLAAGAGVYTYYYLNQETAVEKYMLMIVGVLMIAVGIFSLVMTLIKIHNTKLVMKQEQMKREQAAKASATAQQDNSDVKIIHLNDLKKNDRKQIQDTDSDMIVVEEEDDTPDNPTDNDNKQEDNSNDTDKTASTDTDTPMVIDISKRDTKTDTKTETKTITKTDTKTNNKSVKDEKKKRK